MSTPIENIINKIERIGTVYALPSDTIHYCANKMHKTGAYAIVIKDEDKLLGIFTEHDLLNKVFANKLDRYTEVEKVMTTNLITCNYSATIKDVLKIMINNNIRHLPIVENGDFKDMISISEINKAMLEIQELEIFNLMEYIHN